MRETPKAAIRASQVFVPGRFPNFTYNPRNSLGLEDKLRDYLDERGAILTISGPTKTGKTTLVKSVAGTEAIWVHGQGIDSIDELWTRIGDRLEVYTNYKRESSDGSRVGGGGGAKLGVPGIGLESTLESYFDEQESASRSVDRPIGAVVQARLEREKPLLVIDDFHFIPSAIQKNIVRALKPLVFADVPVCFIAITHRVGDVVKHEKDMTGRVTTLRVATWDQVDLKKIAAAGFTEMNLRDSKQAIAETLARASFGSPHLMQKFCREVCKENGYSERPLLTSVLSPPTSWTSFFEAQVDETSGLWFSRFLTGPAPGGKPRTVYDVKDNQKFDQYGLTLLALKQLSPEMAIAKIDIDRAVASLVTSDGPAPHQTTRTLQHMSKIAMKSLEAPLRSDEELNSATTEDPSDVQPVVEYIEDGPSSAMHLVDPFFAFYLQWGSSDRLKHASEVLKTGKPSLFDEDS